MSLLALLFDFDGVVIDSEPIHYECFVRVMRQRFGIELDRELYFSRYLAFTDAEALEAMAEDYSLDIDPATAREIIDRKTRMVMDAFNEGIEPLAGAIELMRAAREAGLAVAICSGALREEIIGPATTVGAMPYVQLVVSAEDVERGKPDPAGYELTRRRLAEMLGREISAHQCVVIEDSPGGVQAGKAAGMAVLAVTTTTAAENLTQADRVVRSLAEVELEDLRELVGAEGPSTKEQGPS
jgi:beta-phosphoglucomutase